MSPSGKYRLTESSSSEASDRKSPAVAEQDLRMSPRRRRGALVTILAGSLLLNSFHLQWGLPNDNTTWAADAVKPLTPLSVAKKSFARPNSGWFYFKYPIGHPLLLLAAYAPYLGGLYLTGRFHRPQSDYPYGFGDPESALKVLSIIGRFVSVAMGVGSVAIVYALGAQLFEPAVGLVAAAGAATSMGLVFYAHTTNLDVPVMFWMLLALLCSVRLMDEVRWRDCMTLGVAAGLGMATKETAVGILVALPIFIAVAQLYRLRPWSKVTLHRTIARLSAGAACSLLVYGCASNAFYNPAGLFNRWRYLTDTLPAEFFGTLVPRATYISATEGLSLATHLRLLRELGIGLGRTVGIPLYTAGLCGVVLAAVWKPKATLMLAILYASFYWFTLASLPLVAVRYILPLGLLLMLFAGVFLVSLARRGRVGQVVVGVVLLASLVYGGSVNYLLLRDPRYAAEAWLREHAVQRTVEVYNRATFLPRFPAGVRTLRPRFTEITRQGVTDRHPDFILLNMADINRVTGRYATHQTGVRKRPENVAFLHALLAGELGYRAVARFHEWSPLIPDGVIRSLNPEIVVFARS
jgi:4-amino-4-deoxy-L-arabinose transferase-like glycosyltransferase